MHYCWEDEEADRRKLCSQVSTMLLSLRLQFPVVLVYTQAHVAVSQKLSSMLQGEVTIGATKHEHLSYCELQICLVNAPCRFALYHGVCSVTRHRIIGHGIARISCDEGRCHQSFQPKRGPAFSRGAILLMARKMMVMMMIVAC